MKIQEKRRPSTTHRRAKEDGDVREWKALVPLLCAFHCVLAPFLAALLPALAFSDPVEWGFLVAAAGVAFLTVPGGVSIHRRHRVWIPVLAGVGLWVGSLMGWLAPLPEILVVPGAGLLLAGGLIWNARLRHRAHCGECGCPVPAPPLEPDQSPQSTHTP